ncbi:MAG: serine hydrolase [Acidobacteriota bacterium]
MLRLVLILITAVCAHAQLTPQQAAALDARIRARVAGFPGHVSLHAKNLKTGAEYGMNPDEQVRTASTIKLPILCALHDQVAQGKVKWEEELTLTEADTVSGSGIFREFSPGTKHRVRDVANLMIVVSDNTATNLILGRITADAVNDYMVKLGILNTKSLRKVRGDGNQLKSPSGFAKEGMMSEYRRFGLGVSTPHDMVRLLELIEAGKVVSRKDSQEILAVLGRQQFKDSIGRRLPDRWVFSKSGSLDALRSDVGIVRAPGGPVAMALTVDGMPGIDYGPENSGQRLLSDLAQMLLDALTR